LAACAIAIGDTPPPAATLIVGEVR